MGKFASPLSCFSCTCFSSSFHLGRPPLIGFLPMRRTEHRGSLTRQASVVRFCKSSNELSFRKRSVNPLTRSLSSQQPPKIGVSTSSSSQQHSSSSQPSPATVTDLKTSLQNFKEISQLRDLINLLEDFLKIASGEKNEGGSSSEVSSYIQDGQKLLEFVDKHVGKLPQKKDSMDGFSAETEKILIKLLEGAGKIRCVGAALSVLGFVLSRFNEISNNKSVCLEILKAMVNLGKQIVELNEQMPGQKEKLNEAVECIIVGCCMCISQLETSKIFRFLTSSVTAHSLKDFQVRVGRLYIDLQTWCIIDLQKRLPRIASQSPELYANEGAVGIDSARDEVIRLLDLSAQHTSARVVVVHGLGGIGKTTLADAVYAHIDLHSYNYCRIYMDQNCTENDLKVLQEQILNGLFQHDVKLSNFQHGRGLIKSLSLQNPDQPLFLYIDNGLKNTDLENLLLGDLSSWLPQKSRILVTTRNLHETDMFVSRKIERKPYAVIPLPEREARKILLKNVWDYNDEANIKHLLDLCEGVPLLLELAGSQLAINSKRRNYIVLEMLREGEKVEEKDISDRMVDFVYHRLLPSVKEAFLDIACFFRRGYDNEYVAYIVGEEEFRALEEASLVKTSERGGVIVHDIVRARGKKMSEGSRITEPERLSECLKDEEKLKNLKGIHFDELFEQPPIAAQIEINKYHLNCMSNSLSRLSYDGASQITLGGKILSYHGASQITFSGKCYRPFKQLRVLSLPSGISDLPMEFEKLERLVYYSGPLTQGMSLYKLPPNLRTMRITNIICSESGIANSKNSPEFAKDSSDSPEAAQDCSLVRLTFPNISAMEMLPDGVETLTKLEKLIILDWRKLRKLPSKIGKLTNLEELTLSGCSLLEEWPLSFGDLSKLKILDLRGCSSKLKESLPDNIKQNCKIYYEKYWMYTL